MDPMRWLVSFDLTPQSEGAVRLGRWLHTRSGGRHQVYGVHAVDDAGIGLHNSLGAGPDLREAEQEVRAFLERHEVADAFTGVATRHGDPEKVVHGMVREQPVDGVLVGRAAPVSGFSLASLGRVTRRVLRRPEQPVLVVPPEFREWTTDPGPVVVGVSPSPEGVEAVRFARRLGAELGLPVVMVHAVRRGVPVASLGPIAVQPRDPGMTTSDIAPPLDTTDYEAALRAWVVEHALHEVPLELRQGPAAAVLHEVGREREAALLVCGARRLSRLERLLSSTVGHDLAAHTDRPVVVVPPPE